MYSIKLKIADIIIEFKSKIPMQPFDRDVIWKFANFIYKGSKRADISLEVRLVKNLPNLDGSKRLFLTRHPESKQDNWAIFRNSKGYILREYLEAKQQHIILNHNFSKGLAYLRARPVESHRDLYRGGRKERLTWKIPDLIYDALQIILISYLSRRDGAFVHSVGIKDKNGEGFMFVGKSGAGKSTTARLWHKNSHAQVLNDDRMIMRKINNLFYIYGTPWHGDFNDYLASRQETVRLGRLFFIFHSKKNQFMSLAGNKIFTNLYPNIFFAFWDKESLEKTLGLCDALTKAIPSYSLGFKNTKQVIRFVRRLQPRRMSSSVIPRLQVLNE